MKPSPIESALVHLAETERKTVGFHHKWREALAGHDSRLDEVDLLVDDLTTIDPHECHAPSRRSDKSLGDFLSLLDNLPTGNDGKENTR